MLAVGFFGVSTVPKAFAQGKELIGFEPLPRSAAGGDWIGVSPDYETDIMIPWGNPIASDGPAFAWPPTAQNQAEQIGIGHDGMWFFQTSDPQRGVLCVNHEYGTTMHVLGKSHPESFDEVLTLQHAHGASVLELQKIDGKWQQVTSKLARRIHVNTPIELGGPAANSPLLRSDETDQAQGILNNCGCGHTPWDTYLTCEENFNLYFGATNSEYELTSEQERYGFQVTGIGWNWHLFDKRFDLGDEASARVQNRFGWVVEIDPFNPSKPPVKRTALGRFKHEACEVVIGKDNRIVAYMGDDQRFDYIYKFVSAEDYKVMLDRGDSPLDSGTLYVARFHDDLTGEWLELSESNEVLREKIGSLDRILTYARMAADLVGATPMDRPEWMTTSPDGTVYCSLTNNSQRREVDAVNPLAPNLYGHIVRWKDDDNHVGTTFTWNIFKVAKTTHGSEESFASPDSLWMDPDGRLFIATDGSQSDDLNDQLLVANSVTGEVKRLFSGVPGCEITGITPNADQTELFVNVQHPGNGDISETDFPRIGKNQKVPRDATVVIRKKDGGVVGS